MGLATGLAVLLLTMSGWALFFALARQAVAWTLRWRRWLGWARWPLLAVLVIGFPWLALYVPNTAKKLTSPSARWLGYGLVAVLAAWLLAPEKAQRISFADLLRGLLLSGASFAFLSAYTQVTAYPFSLSWSEGNRLWDYSLLFARRRYLYPADQPIFAHIDPGRQFLWGLVYLIPGVGIFGVRLWSAFLFTVPYGLFAWALFAKPARRGHLAFWLGLWGFLFLNQGPIYTPLVLSAWLVLGAVRDVPWGLGLLLALGAGYYATLTRYTWFLAPPLWALLLAVGLAKHASLPPRRRWLLGGSYALSALVGAGLTGNLNTFFLTAWALASRWLGIGVQNTNATGEAFAARQPLLWSRLWPNPTFPPGIALGLLLAVGPLLFLWALGYRRGLWTLPRAVALLAAGSLLYFLAVGTVASLKIGGGNNLHNLDMLLISMLMLTALLGQQRARRWLQQQRGWSLLEQGVVLALVTVPLYFAFLYATPRRIPEERWWRPALKAVQQAVHEAHAQGGAVLFLDPRQLFTFGFVEPVPLIPEYEKKYMMDQAMAENRAYFEGYYRDLAHHRFALIVSEPLDVRREKEAKHNFAAENNAWVKWVAAPTLCYYEPKATFRPVGLQLLVPREEHVDCRETLP